MIRNNQNGRRRGRGGARPPQAGGIPREANYNGGGNRNEVRQRGNATQLLEKYKTLARDATQNGDRVAAEYYMQYADHYYRVLNDYRERQPDRPQQRRDFDDEDGYAGDAAQYGNGAANDRYTAPDGGDDDGGDSGADDGYRAQADGRRDYTQQAPRRNDAPRETRNDQPRGDQRSNQSRGDQRADQPRGDQRNGQPHADPSRNSVQNDGRGEVLRQRGDEIRHAPRRDAREDASEPVEMPVFAGIPGPARVEPLPADRARDRAAEPNYAEREVAPAASDVDKPDLAAADRVAGTDAAAAPVARKRGRPRKVVAVETDV